MYLQLYTLLPILKLSYNWKIDVLELQAAIFPLQHFYNLTQKTKGFT